MFVWSEDRVALLRKLWDQGASYSECAKKIGGGLSRSAIAGKVRRIGLPYRTDPKDSAAARIARVQRARQQAKLARERTKKAREPAPPRKIIAAAEPVIDRAPLDPLGPDIAHAPAQTCLWINGDPMVDGRTCGRHAEDGSWCKHHRALVYVKPKANLAGVERYAHWSDRNGLNLNMSIFGGSL